MKRLLFLILFPILVFGLPSIESQISKAKALGKKPVIFVDLDATLYSGIGRVQQMVRRFDESRGSHYFDSVDWKVFWKIDSFDTAARDHFKKLNIPNEEKESVLVDYHDFEKKERFSSVSIYSDLVYKPLRDAILQWKKMGAQIVFLTGRDGNIRKFSQDRLNGDGMVNLPLVMRITGNSTAVSKMISIADYSTQNPKSVPIALIDDAIENLQILSETFPKMLALKTTQLSEDELVLENPLEEKIYDTAKRYSHRVRRWKNVYIPSRQALHEQIISHFSLNIPSSDKPIILFAAGGFGVGKSTIIKLLSKNQILSGESFLQVNPDEIREWIPEYRQYKEMGLSNVVAPVHTEVGHVKEDLVERALKQQQSIIIDGSLRNLDWNAEEFERIRKKYPNYRIGILQIRASKENTYFRQMERAQLDRRGNDEESIDKVQMQVDKTVAALSKSVDFMIEIENDSVPTLRTILDSTGIHTFNEPLPGNPVLKSQASPGLSLLMELLDPRFLASNCVQSFQNLGLAIASPP